MDIFRLTILFSLLVSAFFLWKKPGLGLTAKFITLVHLMLLILITVLIILLFNNYKLSGIYSNTITGTAFLVTGILLFGVTKHKIIKIYAGIIFSVNLLFQVAMLFAPNGLLLFYAMACYMFQPPYMTKKLTAEKQLEFYEPFLGPPPIYLTEKEFGILKSQRWMVLQKGAPYYKPGITSLQQLTDTSVECSIILNSGNIVKDTLITVDEK